MGPVYAPKLPDGVADESFDLLKLLLGTWVDPKQSTYEIQLDDHRGSSCTVRTHRPNGQKIVTRGLITISGSKSSSATPPGSLLWGRSYTLDAHSATHTEIRWVHRSHGSDFVWRRMADEKPHNSPNTPEQRLASKGVEPIDDIMEEEQTTEDEGQHSKSSKDNDTDGEGWLAAIVDRQLKVSEKQTSTPSLFQALERTGLKNWSKSGCTFAHTMPDAEPVKIAIPSLNHALNIDRRSAAALPSYNVPSSFPHVSNMDTLYLPRNSSQAATLSELCAEAPVFVPDVWHPDVPFCPLTFAQAHAYLLPFPDFMLAGQPPLGIHTASSCFP